MEEIHRIEPVLLNVGIYLAALLIGVITFRRLGLGSALGYLLVGSIVGPAALGLVGDDHTVETLAELGVVLLLFVIGLELRAKRLWRLRIDIFGVGTAQLVITTAVLGSLLHLVIGWEWGPSLVTAAALSLSSTAFGVQLLEERKAIGTPFADRAISILLLQDMALVPLVAMVTLFAPVGAGVAATELDTETIAIAVASLAVLVGGGYFLVNPLFRLIARTGADEAFTAGALLVVVAAALLMQFAGLSMAMGAVIAGILLADSEFRHRIEAAVDPFRGLLLGMFFMGIGVGLDWLAVLRSLPLILGCAVGLFAIKALILFALARIRGSTVTEAIRIGLLLGQAGEFGFLLFGLAAASGVFDIGTASILTAIAVLSMALTPIVLKLADRQISVMRTRYGTESDLPEIEETPPAPVLVVGYGRFGQTVVQVLARCGHTPLLIDSNIERVRVARAQGYEAHFGNLGGRGVIGTVAKRGLRAIVVCIDDTKIALRAVSELRERFPDVPLLARVRDRYSQWEMLEVGADTAVREVHEAAMRLAGETLSSLGEGDSSEEVLESIRCEDQEELERMAASYTRADVHLESVETDEGNAPSPSDEEIQETVDDDDQPVPTTRPRPPSWQSMAAKARRALRKPWADDS